MLTAPILVWAGETCSSPLVVDSDTEEMITLFHVFGALIYYDEQNQIVSHDDVHTKIEMCRKHYAAVGLGEDYVHQFIR